MYQQGPVISSKTNSTWHLSQSLKEEDINQVWNSFIQMMTAAEMPYMGKVL